MYQLHFIVQLTFKNSPQNIKQPTRGQSMREASSDKKSQFLLLQERICYKDMLSYKFFRPTDLSNVDPDQMPKEHCI